LLAALLALAAALPAQARSKNVILMIGDGMGFSVLGFAQDHAESAKSPPLRLREAMRRGATGLLSTRSATHLVTDSAAAATAMANDVVGMDRDGRPLENLFELAQARGLAVGAVTTDRLSGATPGSFTSHASHRRQNSLIASQQLQNRIPVLLGGGAEDFDLQEAKRVGYWIMTTRKHLLSEAALKKPLWLGVFNSTEMPYVADRAPDDPSLPEMTAAALRKLSADQDGFLLLIEGARIDHAAHSNLTKRAIEEFLEFDAALGEVLEFLKAHPDTTLFLTADHDTGGGGLTKTDQEREYPVPGSFPDAKDASWLSHHHTSEPVVLVGVGPDGDGAAGWNDNTRVFSLVKEALGL
jgi:alkaline phosphatase